MENLSTGKQTSVWSTINEVTNVALFILSAVAAFSGNYEKGIYLLLMIVATKMSVKDL